MPPDRKDDRLNLRINRKLKQDVQEYCDRRGIEVSELLTRFFKRIVQNERHRLETQNK